MDRITEQILADYVKENDLQDLPEDKQFEHLAAFLTVRRHYSRAFQSGDLIMGGGGDTGIDGIAIIVNGMLITDIDDITELVDRNGYLEATFIFIQAERSSAFDTAKTGTFAFGVLDFFSDQPKLPRNALVADAAAIMSAIYDQSTKFRGRPSCHLYYVTTGKWLDDQNLNARREAAKSDLDALEQFREIEFSFIGAEDLQKLFQKTKNAITREFDFEDRVEIKSIPGVPIAFLGFIPAPEFFKIIRDEAGDDINGSIFYDNVRDWQDYNPVNSEMRETLLSDMRSQFVLMNNGVTIIAKTLKQFGSKFSIEDFQIVNGCQTSHVLFDQRKVINDSVTIPLRLIATDNEEVIEAIIVATNRQTELKAEQLYALTTFSKKLETYFSTFEEPHRLYYERRDGQYDRLPLEKSRIVSPQSVIKAYGAMFLDEPHTSSKNYKALRGRVGDTIFHKNDRLEPYYVAAFAAYKLEQQYRSQKLSPKYKSARHHILLAIRLLLEPKVLPQRNSNLMERVSNRMMTALWDGETVDALFQSAARIIDDVSANNLDRETIRTQAITQSILKKMIEV